MRVREDSAWALRVLPVCGWFRVGLLSVVVVVFVLVGGALEARGAQTRLLQATFGSLVAPRGVAVEASSGDVYVVDEGGFRLEKFSPAGQLLLGFGANVGGLGIDTCTMACEVGTEGSGPGEFTAARFVAVDNDPSSASVGDVYVADLGDGTVAKFDSSGSLVGGWGSNGQLKGSATAAGEFGTIAGIAVDAAGRLAVLNTGNEVYEFSGAGSLEAEVALKASGRSVSAVGFGVDGGGNLFKANGGGSVEKFSAGGVDLGEVQGKEAGLGIQPASAFSIGEGGGGLYVASKGKVLEHYAFNGAGEVVEPDGTSCPLDPERVSTCSPTDAVAIPFVGEGVAVTAGGEAVYVSDPETGEVAKYGRLVTVAEARALAASHVTATSVELEGEVNPSGTEVTTCVFEYVDREAYERAVVEKAKDPFAGGGNASCAESAAEIGTGSAFASVHATAAGLEAHAEYEFRLSVANAEAPSSSGAVPFGTLQLPSVSGEKTEALTPTTAELVASVDTKGSETHYHFEYDTREYGSVTEPAHGTSTPVPDAGLAPAGEPSVVRARIEGLTAGVVYHWRLVAANESGTQASGDVTFVYEEPSGLPDHRSYEMVTPPHKNGALIGDVSFLGSVPEVSSDGTRVIASANQCFAESRSCNAQQADAIGSPYEFSRTTTGWSVTPLAPPASVYQVAAPWASNATSGYSLFTMPTEPAGENDFYSHAPDGTLTRIGPNTPPEEGPQPPVGGKAGATVQAATADFSHFAWETSAKWPFDERTGNAATAYEYVGTSNAAPSMVGVTGAAGSTDQVSRCGTRLGAYFASVRNVMSEDGRTVFFTAGPCPGGTGSNAGVPVPVPAVYARVDGELPDAHTVAVSEPSPSECGSGPQAGEASCRAGVADPSGGRAVAAAGDGSKMLFLSTQQLTDNATEDSQASDSATEAVSGCALTTGTGCNLYVYDLTAAAGHHLVDLSAGDVRHEGPRVRGVMAVSNDDSHVYFVAQGVLTSEPSESGQHAASGANNLYVAIVDGSHPAGKVKFIAQLPSSDEPEWQTQPGKPANVTPDGRYLVFLSHGALTADDTSVGGAYQVFRYDSQTGRLVRISVGNDGFNNDGNATTRSACVVECSEDARIVQSVGFPRLDPTMSDDGEFVFFESPVALTAGAMNDVKIDELTPGEPNYAENVYEWHDGHTYLISAGEDKTENHGNSQLCGLSAVCLLGVDSTAANVFFSTADSLVGADQDTEVDYYDARVCTESSPCLSQEAPSVASCGEGCQGSPGSAPVLPELASMVFSGPGNSQVEQGVTGRVKVRVLGRVLRRGGFAVKMVLPVAGKLVVAGKDVRGLHRRIGRGGTYRVVLRLTRQAVRVLRRRRSIAVTVRVSFLPDGAPAQRVSVRLVLKAASQGHGRGKRGRG